MINIKEWKEVHDRSALMSKDLEEQLQGYFQKIKTPIRLVAAFETGQSASREMAIFLQQIAYISENVEVLVVQDDGPIEDEKHFPATYIYDENGYTGITFHGVPGGQEMNSFVMGILYAGNVVEVDVNLKQKAASVEGTHRIDIMVSLSCHHCAKQVVACQKLAKIIPGMQAHMYDARLYSDLVHDYKIERVPLTIIDGNKRLMGVKTEEELLEML